MEMIFLCEIYEEFNVNKYFKSFVLLDFINGYLDVLLMLIFLFALKYSDQIFGVCCVATFSIFPNFGMILWHPGNRLAAYGHISIKSSTPAAI